MKKETNERKNVTELQLYYKFLLQNKSLSSKGFRYIISYIQKFKGHVTLNTPPSGIF